MSPGQLVHPDNGDDALIGFVSSVGLEVSTFTLYEPREIDLEAIGGKLVAIRLPDEHVEADFDAAYQEATPETQAMWQHIIRDLRS
jgi:hypothetical protein